MFKKTYTNKVAGKASSICEEDYWLLVNDLPVSLTISNATKRYQADVDEMKEKQLIK